MHIKALEEFREWIDSHCAVRSGIEMKCRMHEIADAIESEIAEKFMELPVDSDGVPVRPGDVVGYFQDGLKMYVYSVCEDGIYYRYERKIELPLPTEELRHFHPNTVEGILDQLLEDAGCVYHEDGSCEMGLTYEQRAEYAERIRKVLDVKR